MTCKIVKMMLSPSKNRLVFLTVSKKSIQLKATFKNNSKTEALRSKVLQRGPLSLSKQTEDNPTRAMLRKILSKKALRAAFTTTERFFQNKTFAILIFTNFACMNSRQSITRLFLRRKRESFSSRNKILIRKCSDLVKMCAKWISKTQPGKGVRKETAEKIKLPAVAYLRKSFPNHYTPQTTTSLSLQLLTKYRNLTKALLQVCR